MYPNVCNPRACIYVCIKKQSNRFPFTQQILDNDHVTILVNMQILNGTLNKLIIVSAYFPIDSDEPPHQVLS